MRPLVVLDAGAFDALERGRNDELWAMVMVGAEQAEVRCAALTLAEVCRSVARTRQVEVVLRRDRQGRQINVVPTDEALAKRVGQLLADAQRDSCHLADAHVVALCADADRALVITSDPDDINHLAASLRGVRIVTRQP
jgi:predicted nucleic acid-binding protein